MNELGRVLVRADESLHCSSEEICQLHASGKFRVVQDEEGRTVLEAELGSALVAAMVDDEAHRNSAAWSALDRLVQSAAVGDGEFRRPWREAQEADDPAPPLRTLARMLAHRAATDEPLREALTNWLEQYADQPRVLNSITGAASFHGPTVQAGQIQGGVHFHSTVPSEVATPRQIPPPPAHFLGRATDLRTLDTLCAPEAFSVRLLVVTGFAGVGKTTLVSRWLLQRAADFPDGLLYADLGADDSTRLKSSDEVLEHFLRSLGATSIPTGTAERVSLWRSLTSGKRLALMVDSALSSAQVRPLLPAGAGSLVAVTSRSHLTGLLVDGATLHRLEALPVDDSMELLVRRGGGNRIQKDPTSARAVVDLCACLPLALCIAAAQLAVHPRRSLAALVAMLSEGHGPLDGLRADGEAAVRLALDDSYRLLPSRVRETYQRMGLLPSTTYDADMIAAATASSVAEADHALETLIETNLLEENEPGFYKFHDLVRPHARQRGEAEEDSAVREEVLRRFVDWCLASATAAEEILTPSHRTLARTYRHEPSRPIAFEDASTALTWLKSHQSHLAAAVRECARAHWHSTCWQLVDALWPVFLRLRPAEWWIEAHELGLHAARQAGDRSGEARMLTSGAAGLRNASRHREAAEWYDQALRHAREDNDIRQQAQALNGLGTAHLALGELTEAAAHLSRALTLREEIGYRRGAALSRLGLGQIALDRADHEQAVEHFSRARDELLAEGDTYDAARALAFLGLARSRLGDHTSGTRQLEDAVRQFQAAGARHWQARSLEMMGQAAQLRGDTDEARRCYLRSREIYLPLSPLDTRRLEGRLQDI